MNDLKAGDKAIIQNGGYPIFKDGEKVTIGKDTKNKCGNLSDKTIPVETNKNADGYVCIPTKNLKSIEKK